MMFTFGSLIINQDCYSGKSELEAGTFITKKSGRVHIWGMV